MGGRLGLEGVREVGVRGPGAREAAGFGGVRGGRAVGSHLGSGPQRRGAAPRRYPRALRGLRPPCDLGVDSGGGRGSREPAGCVGRAVPGAGAGAHACFLRALSEGVLLLKSNLGSSFAYPGFFLTSSTVYLCVLFLQLRNHSYIFQITNEKNWNTRRKYGFANSYFLPESMTLPIVVSSQLIFF